MSARAQGGESSPLAVARAAVIGSPIGHSKSPLLHGAAYRELGIELDYSRIEAREGDAAALVERLRSEPGWRGLSCTMPMKAAMVPFMDQVSDRVKRLGVLNTVIVEDAPSGPRLRGENTDVDGIVRTLMPGIARPEGALNGARLAILGAGGTAAAVLEAASILGVTAVDLVVRSPERAADTAALGVALGLAVRVTDVAGVAESLGEYDVVVSTLPPRAADPLVPALLASGPRAGAPLLDVAYDPWPSALTTAWIAAGGRGLDGLDMLVHQAVEQALLFSRVEATPGVRELVTNVMCDAAGTPRHLA